MNEKKGKNEMCSGNPVSAKSLGVGKSNRGRGKGSTSLPAPKVQELEEQPKVVQRHGEHR